MQRAGTLFFTTLCWAFCSLLIAGAALAQDDQYDCASFGSQESAQAELERDPSDPSNLDGDDDGEACETYPYNGGGGGGGGDDGELDCADFTYQEEAQTEFEKDTSDPYGLDGPIGEAFDGEQGVACEELPSRPNSGDGGSGDGGGQPPGGTGDGRTSGDETPADDQYTIKPGPVDNPKGVMPGTGVKKVPVTGGPPYLAFGALALLGAALITGRGMLRR